MPEVKRAAIEKQLLEKEEEEEEERKAKETTKTTAITTTYNDSDYVRPASNIKDNVKIVLLRNGNEKKLKQLLLPALVVSRNMPVSVLIELLNTYAVDDPWFVDKKSPLDLVVSIKPLWLGKSVTLPPSATMRQLLERFWQDSTEDYMTLHYQTKTLAKMQNLSKAFM